MSDKDEKGEPTMEEILASIRQIISDEEKDEGAEDAPAAPAEEPTMLDEPEPDPEPEAAPDPEPEPEPAPEPEPNPVLELTRVVNDDGSVSDIEEAQVGDIDMLDSRPEPADPASLVSDPIADKATNAFGNLSNAVSSARSMPMGNANRTLEDVVKELLKPMLRDWLDSNLPHIVERLVEREVAKLAARADRD